MCALNTNGFALSALPRAPDIPSNIGKIDVKAIFDAVQHGLSVADAVRMGASRETLERAQNQLGTKTALAGLETLPSQTQAAINTNTRTATLAGPDVVGTERNLALAKNTADTSGEINRGNVNKFVGGLSPERQIILAKEGPATATTGTTRVQDGQIVSDTTKTATVGDTAVPVASERSTSPASPVLTTLPNGPGGTPLGTAVTTIGPDGKPSTHVAQPPLAALNNIVTGSRLVKVGTDHDESGNPIDILQQQTHSAVSNEWVPHGAPIKRAGTNSAVGTVLQDTGAGGGDSRPFISKDATKAIEDTQAEIQTLSNRKLELENISNAAENFITSGLGAGRVAGPLQKFLGLAPAQKFVGSVKNALQTALQPLRGTGRVSNTEFNQALDALPTIDDQPDTIRAKMSYLNLATDWALTRQQAYLDALGSGLNRYQAFQKAQRETPIPEAPNFYANPPTSLTTGTTPTAASTTAPAVIPEFSTEKDAEAAAAAGTLQKGQKIKIGGVSGTWQ